MYVKAKSQCKMFLYLYSSSLCFCFASCNLPTSILYETYLHITYKRTVSIILIFFSYLIPNKIIQHASLIYSFCFFFTYFHMVWCIFIPLCPSPFYFLFMLLFSSISLTIYLNDPLTFHEN